MWLRAWFSLLCLLHVCSQLHPMALSVQYIFAGRYSSVLLEGYSGSELQKGSMIKWSLVLRDRISLMVLHVIGSPNIRYSDYYIHRIDYNTRNGSLTLNNIDLDDRGIYENTITTYGETVQKSYYIKVLDVRGLLLLHRYTFITSIIALVSTSTSFAASIFIIFFALGTYRVHKRHVQLTAVFVLFQLLSFISLLTAALFCVFDPDFPIPYRIIDVLGLFLVIAMIIYILVLYLHPETKLKRSFLIKTNHRYFFLVYGSLSVIISAAPIYRGYNNIKVCQYPISQTSGNATSAAVVYVFILGLIFILFTKYMRSWNQVRKLSRVSLR
ncbi:uncharacterized protein LOC132394738 isoform X8 [Hypanus sabinus]|uniref:uncharacterized protein LOC132394738 isoform X8 n=1 Tax=Hypanus sabinus TaxID=79690 RepID=UPI0028C4CE2C|nr:uncharacterized protein LOC132394738 isoform X8 [Hypanus sabinus]